MVAIFDWIRRFSFKFCKSKYKEVFEVANYDSEVENEKFKMEDSIGGDFWLNSKFFF